MNVMYNGLQDQLNRISHGNYYNPHAILGLHTLSSGKKVIRLYRPHATNVHLELFGNIVEANKIHQDGFFEYPVPENTHPLDYRVYHQDGSLAYDPYAFW